MDIMLNTKTGQVSQEHETIHLLHIEDDDIDAFLVQKNLKKNPKIQYDIARARTLSDGIHKLHTYRYDAILLDLHLPDGEQAYCVQQIHDRANDTPIILLTSLDDHADDTNYIALGAQDYITKLALSSDTLQHSIRYAMLRNKKQRAVATLAHRDPLTGLLNRRIIVDRISHAVMRHRRSLSKMAVIFIDLNDFKLVNDTRGHAAGDKVLCFVSNALKQSVRKDDSVARLGGDEFAILLENIRDFEDLNIILKKIIDKVSEPLTIAKEALHIRISIGVSTLDGANNDGSEESTAETLLEEADHAMYQAKQSKNFTYQIFDRSQSLYHQLKLADISDDGATFNSRQLRITYAPIVTEPDKTLAAGRASLLWCHQAEEHLITSDFFSIIQKMNIAAPLTEWFLTKAMEEWHTYCSGSCENALTAAKNACTPKLFLRLPPQFFSENMPLKHFKTYYPTQV